MLRPQDVLCVLKISCMTGEEWGLRELGRAVFISLGEAHNVFKRLKASGLVYEPKPGEVKVASRKLYEFLVYGAPTVYYQERGPVVRGVLTGSSMPSLAGANMVGRKTEVDVPLVWPTRNGRSRGETLVPIYETAPDAAAADPRLYELLALVDCLRTGRTKERKVAAELLADRLGVSSQAQSAEEV